MIAFLVDQNFNEHIVDGLTRRDETIDFIHVRDIGLAAALDSVVLEWAAAHGLVLLTQWGMRSLPKGFIPSQDMGYLVVNVQLPDAASEQRASAVMARAEQIVR